MKKTFKITGILVMSAIMLTSCNSYDIKADAKALAKVKCELKNTLHKDPNYQILKAKEDSITKVVKERYYDDREDRMNFEGLMISYDLRCPKKFDYPNPFK